jgi:hypothetical protein
VANALKPLPFNYKSQGIIMSVNLDKDPLFIEVPEQGNIDWESQYVRALKNLEITLELYRNALSYEQDHKRLKYLANVDETDLASELLNTNYTNWCANIDAAMELTHSLEHPDGDTCVELVTSSQHCGCDMCEEEDEWDTCCDDDDEEVNFNFNLTLNLLASYVVMVIGMFFILSAVTTSGWAIFGAIIMAGILASNRNG